MWFLLKHEHRFSSDSIQNPARPVGLKGGCKTFAALVSLNSSYKGFKKLQLTFVFVLFYLPIIFLINQVIVGSKKSQKIQKVDALKYPVLSSYESKNKIYSVYDDIKQDKADHLHI